MSITYPLSLPSSPSARNVTFGANNLVSAAISPFTGSSQITTWPGEWWEAQVALPAMSQSVAAPWVAFLTALRGQSGTFLLGDPTRKTPQGVATGTPVVSGAQPGGAIQLSTSGWTHNVTGILKAGDYIQIGDGNNHGSPATLYPQRLHMVLTDANSDSSGNATLNIFPCIRPEGAYNGETVVTSNAVGLFRLANNWRQWQVDFTRMWVIDFKAVEGL